MEPKYFWNAPNYKISFADADGNFIDIYPRNKGVHVSLLVGGPIDFDIPHNYNEYKYSIESDIKLSDANLKSLLKCENATYLSINDANDLAYKLMLHINDLKKMTQLRTLKLYILREHLPLIQLAPFLEQLVPLQFATFVFPDSKEHEIEEFLNRQSIPSYWILHGNYADSAIFHRKGKYMDNNKLQMIIEKIFIACAIYRVNWLKKWTSYMLPF